MIALIEKEENRKGLRRNDLTFRMAYTRPELSRILPFGQTTLDEMIKKGAFPSGVRPLSGGRRIWPRKLIEEWLEHFLTGQQGKVL